MSKRKPTRFRESYFESLQEAGAARDRFAGDEHGC